MKCGGTFLQERECGVRNYFLKHTLIVQSLSFFIYLHLCVHYIYIDIFIRVSSSFFSFFVLVHTHVRRRKFIVLLCLLYDNMIMTHRIRVLGYDNILQNCIFQFFTNL